MFFKTTLTTTLHLPPHSFTSTHRESLLSLLYSKEGTVLPSTSTVLIAVLRVTRVSDGAVLPGRGVAEYSLSFDALVFHVFPGEAVLGRVCGLSRLGLFVDCGALLAFVSVNLCPPDLVWAGKLGARKRGEGVVGKGKDKVGEKKEELVTVGCPMVVRIKAVAGIGGKLSGVGDVSRDYLGPL